MYGTKNINDVTLEAVIVFANSPLLGSSKRQYPPSEIVRVGKYFACQAKNRIIISECQPKEEEEAQRHTTTPIREQKCQLSTLMLQKSKKFKPKNALGMLSRENAGMNHSVLSTKCKFQRIEPLCG